MSESQYSADNITKLEGLDAVRKRPGMFIGSTNKQGLHHLVQELIDNSVDEAMTGNADEINVVIHEDNSVSVTDNGRGIPVDDKDGEPAVNMIMTDIHAGGKFDSEAYAMSGGLHGVGVSVVNALSDKLTTIIKRDGYVWKQVFEHGEPQGLEKERKLSDAEETGTYIRFWVSEEKFETSTYDFELIRSRLENLAYLNSGVKFTISDDREERTEEYYFEGGITEFVQRINEGREPLFDSIIRAKGEETVDNGNIVQADIAMQYTTSTQSDNSIFSFANNIETKSGGTHETGFKTAITRVVNKYAEENGMLEEIDGQRLSGNLVREGLTAVISVRHSDPQFEGQTKTKLGNAKVRGVVSSVISNEFSKFLEEHPDAAETIVSKSINAYKAKQAAEKAEELTRRKSATTSTRLPGKLSDCQKGTKPEDAELFIVEGDSAGGSTKQARNPENQAVLPLRGKILNVEKNRLNKILEHDQIQNIITALGTGIDDEFDIDDLRYHTIVLFVDADVDGAHIKTLLLTFLFRHMPELLENGHVYAAKSPLYRIKYNGNTYDAMTEAEREEIVENKCNGNPTNVQRFKGLGEMNPEQLWDATMNPETRRFERITINDAAQADRIFSVLMGSQVKPRRDFIRENAGKVEWEDIDI